MNTDLTTKTQCRACMLIPLEYNSYTDLEESLDPDYGLTFLEGFNLCTRLNAQITDGYPKYLCDLCCNEMRIAYEFMRKAETADRMFRIQESANSQSSSEDDDDFFEHIDGVEKILNIVGEETDFEDVDHVPECKICHKTFKSQKTHAEHMQMVHPEKVTSGKAEAFEKAKSVSLTAEPAYNCVECDRTFPDQNSLENHLNIHTGLRLFDCDQCSMSFFTKSLLLKHTKIQHTTHVKCKPCNKIYTKKYYKAHVETLHNSREVDMTQCPHCNEIMEKRSYRSHIRQVHGTEPEGLLCDECPKVLASAASLRQHIANKHRQREIVNSCHLCRKEFTTTSGYRNHMATVHKPDRKKFPCSICKRQFAFERGLELHTKMHTGGEFQCYLCDKRYVRRYDLNVHMRTHTGNAAFECEHCGKRYQAKGPLNDHIKSKHQGVVFTCDECGNKFACKQSLKTHRITVHASSNLHHFCHLCGEGFVLRLRLRGHLKSSHKAFYSDEEFDALHPKRNRIQKLHTSYSAQLVPISGSDLGGISM